MSLVKRSNQGGIYDPWRDFFNAESLFPTWTTPTRNTLPAVNVSEDEKSYSIDVISPGFKREDFKINVDDDVLTISAETKTESTDNNKQYNRREYSYSSFTRAFRLPENAKDDAISANYNEGILKLNIPKSENQTKVTKEIRVE